MKQDLLTFADWSSQELEALLELALKVKASPADYQQTLSGKSLVALFEKPSLRTRVSFDIGINKLGGHMVYLDSQAGKLSGREDTLDMGANLACWADAIIARVYSHKTLEDLASAAKVPVVNALCDLYHPCQALADYVSLHEHFGSVAGLPLSYIGDGNNVSHSLMLVGAILGADVRIITPPGYEPDAAMVEKARERAAQSGGSITISNDLAAAAGCKALYTDTWLSMGDTTPLEQIKAVFMPYQLNMSLLRQTGASVVMHCQPAHRDLEITSELVDSDYSLLFLQAENRMHAQNAILISLLGQ
ncbi:ornithine carbamoyltransferase [Lacimicrobium alkaliphilum]|uniref:Ornithine carbamoyltransferase n=1 Tax=Lacimicrobium alkaliphilum TaxID=1526571 RepID=A0ABQ1RKN3_9ALTE|nr:ornithine carbamoyltransferase [Lacimicrobium alkaliphilum]GGD73697.1 ornithine carbamoyltransferase [Lacimicrobium alkaliphilum]